MGRIDMNAELVINEKTTINVWRPNVMEGDKNQKVFIPNFIVPLLIFSGLVLFMGVFSLGICLR